MKKVTLFTDGSCFNLTGRGGWACLIRSRGTDRIISGTATSTTSNRMELQAVISGLRSLLQKSKVEVITDSRYVIDGITDWIHQWKRRGWKKVNGQTVMNKDLWVELNQLARKHRVNWTWVKGHSGHEENTRVDKKSRLMAEQAGLKQTA